MDDDSLSQLENEVSPRSGRRRDQSMPLLVGLMDSASARRSTDGTLQLQYQNGTAADDLSENIDLEELAAKQTAGGGMLDSVANMANSILGADIVIIQLGIPLRIETYVLLQASSVGFPS